jgi:hypothetical protein
MRPQSLKQPCHKARGLSDKLGTDAPPQYAFGATGIPSEDQAMTLRACGREPANLFYNDRLYLNDISVLLKSCDGRTLTSARRSTG